jgi:hypothetical protein
VADEYSGGFETKIAVLGEKMDNVRTLIQLNDERTKGLSAQLEHVSTTLDARSRQTEADLVKAEAERERLAAAVDLRFLSIRADLEATKSDVRTKNDATQLRIAAVVENAKNKAEAVDKSAKTALSAHLGEHRAERSWVRYAVNAVIAFATALGTLALVLVTVHP